jgi:hypothetical protein
MLCRCFVTAIVGLIFCPFGSVAIAQVSVGCWLPVEKTCEEVVGFNACSQSACDTELIIPQCASFDGFDSDADQPKVQTRRDATSTENGYKNWTETEWSTRCGVTYLCQCEDRPGYDPTKCRNATTGVPYFPKNLSKQGVKDCWGD